MPRIPSTLSKNRRVTCEVCGATVGRKADLPRHMVKHQSDMDKYMHSCPHPGCEHRTLQKTNLDTHIRSHTGEKPFSCPHNLDDGEKCTFATGDPGSLTRHRKNKHGYVAIRGKKKNVVPTQEPESTFARDGSVASSLTSSIECDLEESFATESVSLLSSASQHPFVAPVNVSSCLIPATRPDFKASYLESRFPPPTFSKPEVNPLYPAHPPRWFDEFFFTSPTNKDPNLVWYTEEQLAEFFERSREITAVDASSPAWRTSKDVNDDLQCSPWGIGFEQQLPQSPVPPSPVFSEFEHYPQPPEFVDVSQCSTPPLTFSPGPVFSEYEYDSQFPEFIDVSQCSTPPLLFSPPSSPISHSVASQNFTNSSSLSDYSSPSLSEFCFSPIVTPLIYPLSPSLEPLPFQDREDNNFSDALMAEQTSFEWL